MQKRWRPLMLHTPKLSLFKEYKMKKLLLLLALLFPVMASAQQLPASGGRTQGMPDGYGDLVQINCKTGCSTSGPSSTQLPATLGPKMGALSLSVVPNTDTAFPVTGTFWQATQPVSGTVAAIQSGTWNLTNISGTISLPTGAATSALQTTMNTTLGSPFQAGGSIGNTTFVATQSTASSFNAQVVGNVASGATDTGNVIAIGGQFNSTFTPFTTGQRTFARMDQYGQFRTMMVASAVAAADGISNANATSVAGSGSVGGAVQPLATAGYFFNGTTFDRPRSITGAVADGTGLGVQAVEQAGALFNNITSATTTTVKSGKGILHKIVLNTYVAAATITIYDNTAGSGTKIGTLTLPATITGDTPITLSYDLQFNTGLTFVTSGATDITVIYR